MAMERDPRIDPQSGDVLELRPDDDGTRRKGGILLPESRERRRVIDCRAGAVTFVDAHSAAVQRGFQRSVITSYAPLADWRAWASKASVVKVGTDPRIEPTAGAIFEQAGRQRKVLSRAGGYVRCTEGKVEVDVTLADWRTWATGSEVVWVGEG